MEALSNILSALFSFDGGRGLEGLINTFERGLLYADDRGLNVRERASRGANKAFRGFGTYLTKRNCGASLDDANRLSNLLFNETAHDGTALQ